MADLKLFRVSDDEVSEIPGTALALEKSLQTLIERHLETFLGVRFLASEYSTTKSHSGRIDTLGIDDANSPVIIEYKRALNESVINQGLFYLDWLLDHQDSFKWLVKDRLGDDAVGHITWQFPRLVCIAGDFTKYDLYAVQQIPRNIELIRYKRYGEDLVALEQLARSPLASAALPLVNHPSTSPLSDHSLSDELISSADFVQKYPVDLQNWFHQLRAFILGLGDDTEERVVATSSYVAFRRLRTFAYLNFMPKKGAIGIDLPLPHGTVPFEPGFVEPKAGKWIRVWIDSAEHADRAQSIVAKSYELH